MNTKQIFFLHILKAKVFSPLFFVLLFFFSVSVYGNFFILNHFFSDTGSTSFVPYFSFIPYISVIIIPVLVFPGKDIIFDDFLPLKNFKLQFYRFLSDFVAFVIFLIPGLLVPFIVNKFGDADFRAFFSGNLFLIFYGLCSISLCRYCYSVLKNQISALFLSVILLSFIVSIGKLPEYLTLNTFFSKLVRFFSFSWRFDSASKGIFDSKDILFFIIFTFVNFSGSYICLEKKKGKIYPSFLTRRYAYIAVLYLLLLILSQILYFRLDFSKSRLFSLSSYTKEIIKNTQDQVNITYYYSGKLENRFPEIKNVNEFLKSYIKESSLYYYKAVNTDKNIEYQTLLNSYGVQPQKIRNPSSANGDTLSVYSAIVIEAKGRIEIIPFVLSAASLEYDLNAKLLSLLFDKQRTCGIIMGNGLSLEKNYSYIKPWLSNQGIFVTEIDCDSLSDFYGPVIVIGENYLSSENAAKIEEYALKNKGNVLIMTNPYNVSIFNDWTLEENQNTYISQMLENLGVTFNTGLAADNNCVSISFIEDMNSKETISVGYPFWVKIPSSSEYPKEINLFWSVPFTVTDKYETLISTSDSSWLRKLDFSDSKLTETNPFSNELKQKNFESNNSFILGTIIQGHRKGYYTNIDCKDAEIYFISDQYFLNSLLNEYAGGKTGNFSNFEYITYIITRMNGLHELAQLQNKNTMNYSVYKHK